MKGDCRRMPPLSLAARMYLFFLKALSVFHLINPADYKRVYEVLIVRASSLFDSDWYLQRYPDVAKWNGDPAWHYAVTGWRENRDPSARFSTAGYFRLNPDVKAANRNPLVHYELSGCQEGRRIEASRACQLGEPVEPSAPFDSRYEEDQDFSGDRTDIKILAWYLPKFHSFKENDEWWGKGFTEWTNTRQSHPRYRGHYQPREPHADIGYYDLADWRTMARQAKLARRHGIYGFCIYNYWFSGKRLMEKPVDQLLEHPEIDIKFCLCWANENWTRAWDGGSNQILMQQGYEEDAVAYIQDLAKYIKDTRYIRVDGKPVVMIYRPGLLPDPERTFQRWREWARENGIGEILIWIQRGCAREALSEFVKGADAEVEFPPSGTARRRRLDAVPHGASPEDDGYLFDYQSFASEIISGKGYVEAFNHHVYRGIMLGWDNSARRTKGFRSWYGFSLKTYYRWLTYLVGWSREHLPVNDRFIFVNAWNEWAEGTYLEPDAKYGYSAINTTSRAIFSLPFSDHVPTI